MAKAKKRVKGKGTEKESSKPLTKSKPQECLFCKIIKGEIPVAKIYEDKDVFAFLDISPVTIGHTLIIPKKHSESMLETDDNSLAAVAKAMKKVSKALMKSLNADGINTVINTKPAAGQIIMHLHVHLIPRFKNDNQHLFVWKTGKYQDGKAAEIAKKIKKAL